jgi:hypothetical protein
MAHRKQTVCIGLDGVSRSSCHCGLGWRVAAGRRAATAAGLPAQHHETCEPPSRSPHPVPQARCPSRPECACQEAGAAEVDLVRAGSVPQRSSAGISGHQRSLTVRRNRSSPAPSSGSWEDAGGRFGLWSRRSLKVPGVLTCRRLGSSTVEVAAPAAAVRLGPELALQLHQAPDPGAVGADVGLDVGGRLPDGGQVDAEQPAG